MWCAHDPFIISPCIIWKHWFEVLVCLFSLYIKNLCFRKQKNTMERLWAYSEHDALLFQQSTFLTASPVSLGAHVLHPIVVRWCSLFFIEQAELVQKSWRTHYTGFLGWLCSAKYNASYNTIILIYCISRMFAKHNKMWKLQYNTTVHVYMVWGPVDSKLLIRRGRTAPAEFKTPSDWYDLDKG